MYHSEPNLVRSPFIVNIALKSTNVNNKRISKACTSPDETFCNVFKVYKMVSMKTANKRKVLLCQLYIPIPFLS